jgi:hypothetical protein
MGRRWEVVKLHIMCTLTSWGRTFVFFTVHGVQYFSSSPPCSTSHTHHPREMVMNAKSPSGVPLASAHQKPAFEYPLSRILEPLGFSRHPIRYATYSYSNINCYFASWRFIICVCASIILFTYVCRQHCDADSCRYYRQNITNGLGLFALVGYGSRLRCARDLKAETRGRRLKLRKHECPFEVEICAYNLKHKARKA